MAQVIDHIRAANRNFMELLKRHDAAGIAQLYTADARVLAPDTPMASGTEAIRAFWQGAIDMGFKEAELETVAVDSRADLAYEIGKYVLTLQPAGSPPTKSTGKYVVVWQHRNGGWKLHVDIWNAGAS